MLAAVVVAVNAVQFKNILAIPHEVTFENGRLGTFSRLEQLANMERHAQAPTIVGAVIDGANSNDEHPLNIDENDAVFDAPRVITLADTRLVQFWNMDVSPDVDDCVVAVKAGVFTKAVQPMNICQHERLLNVVADIIGGVARAVSLMNMSL